MNDITVKSFIKSCIQEIVAAEKGISQKIHIYLTLSTTVSVPSLELGLSPAGEGLGGPNSDDWRKKLSNLPTLC